MAEGRLRHAVRRVARLRPAANVLDFRIEQDGPYLKLAFVLRDGLSASALWARDTESGTWYWLMDVARPVNGRHDVVVDLGALPVPAEQEGARLALAVEVTDHRAHGERHRIALARATHTELGPTRLVHVGSAGAARTAIPYPNSAGGISIALDRPLRAYGMVYVKRIVVRDGMLRMRGRLSTRHGELRSAHVMLKARGGDGRLERAVPVQFDAPRTQRDFGQRWYRFDVRIDCRPLFEPVHAGDDTYDAWFRITTAQNPEPTDVRVGHTRLLLRLRTRPGWARRGDHAVAINPFFTFKAKYPSFNISHFDTRTARYLRVMLRLRHVDRLLHAGQQTWLIGEQQYKAQDNGYWFFRYLRENHPSVRAYYVIDPEAPDHARVAPYGNVVAFGSRQHIRLALRATKILGTHHPDYLYPVRTREFGRAMRATQVFLQHGVLGTKWLADMYGKAAPHFETDLFVVSSEREKECAVDDLGYDPDEVVVAGLPRFDALFAGDVSINPRQLLVMPTWREWLVDRDRYPTSEYHETWLQFLLDPRLRRMADEHGLDVVVCLHPNLQRVREYFADAPVRLVAHGEADVQALLKQSAMLVTDYSSVGFDFAFLDKPVAYFQFDRQRFLGPSGSHLELDEELPGPVFRSVDGVIAEITQQLAAGFRMAEVYRARADRFIDHRDRRNCERVYQSVSVTRRRQRVRKRVARSQIVVALVPAIRRSRLYYPAMRRMFALLSRLPADKRLVVFESGLGKQYADSPRYLYEELVRQRPDLKKVWCHNGRLRLRDPHTRVVPRLSMRYFFYLARAKYWVNNQSFPYYLTRRRRGVFVQTWHGTPLKRMLHDLRDVHGRDAGYVKRASRGAQQWSVLVSPNPDTSHRLRSAFGFDGQVLELGYPRNDVLHAPNREELGARVRARLAIAPSARVVLYAPTFRDDQRRHGRFSFSLPLDLDRLYGALGADTVLLIRMHVLVANAIRIPPHLRDFARDVSDYPEIQELYLATDALVTDYSSTFFDFAQLRRPIIFYAYDLATYRDDLRGFYLDYCNELPGPIVETEDALIEALGELDTVTEKYADRLDALLARFAPHDDGHAAERVVREIFGGGLTAR